MFYGLILLCTTNALEYNNSTCLLYSSPAVYDTKEECVVAVKDFLANPISQAMLASDYEPISVECNNVVPEKYRGDKI